MHEELLQGVRGKDKHPGEYRRKQAFIGANLDIHSARFVPPPEHQVAHSMDGLEKFIQVDRLYPSLISIALAHYQFETIHPFEDGNGRVGRLLIMLMLIQYDLLSEPLLYLSAYFERRREEYNDAMWQVSRRGAWENWIAFFLKGVIEESKDTIARAKALLALRDTWRDSIEKTTNSTTPLQLVDPLFSFPAIDIPTAKERLNMTYKSAQKAVGKLEALGFLVETTGQQRNRIYIAKPILELLAADDIPQTLIKREF
jgi:Fic family protein